MSQGQGAGGGVPRSRLLPGAADQAPQARSLLLEVVTRVLHPTMLVVAVHLFLVGLHRPGGGFAAGLLVGLGLVLRRLAGGRNDVGAAARLPAGLVLGVGLTLAGGYALAGPLLGLPPLAEAHGTLDVPVVGELSWGTAYLLDLAIVLVVVGLVTDVLRTLGGEE